MFQSLLLEVLEWSSGDLMDSLWLSFWTVKISCLSKLSPETIDYEETNGQTIRPWAPFPLFLGAQRILAGEDPHVVGTLQLREYVQEFQQDYALDNGLFSALRKNRIWRSWKRKRIIHHCFIRQGQETQVLTLPDNVLGQQLITNDREWVYNPWSTWEFHQDPRSTAFTIRDLSGETRNNGYLLAFFIFQVSNIMVLRR